MRSKPACSRRASIIEVVADRIEAWGITKLVVDPGHGREERRPPAHSPTPCAPLVKLLLPLALVVTPNIPEAEVLSGNRHRRLRRSEEEAARIIGASDRAMS